MHTKAKLARSFFIQDTREESKTQFWKTKDNAPDWLTELCHDAHTDGMLPDDYCYEYIVDALDLIVDHEGDQDEAASHIEADCYTSDLLQWLASDLRRLNICDEAVGEYGTDASEGILPQISAGQMYERTQIFNSVYNSLDNLDEDEIEAA